MEQVDDADADAVELHPAPVIVLDEDVPLDAEDVHHAALPHDDFSLARIRRVPLVIHADAVGRVVVLDAEHEDNWDAVVFGVVCRELEGDPKTLGGGGLAGNIDVLWPAFVFTFIEICSIKIVFIIFDPFTFHLCASEDKENSSHIAEFHL